MPELSECCGAKVYPLWVRRGLTSRVKDHANKSPYKRAGYFCLQCGEIHINKNCRRHTRSMVTIHNKQLAKRDQRPIAAGVEVAQRI